MAEESSSEQTQGVTPTDNQGAEAGASTEGKTLTYEELQAELGKVRREAAERRVKNREAETELTEFRKWKESQMSELEKAQARIAEIDTERRKDYLDIAQAKFGLEADDMEFIHGKTKDEILASAEKYSKRQGRGEGTGAGQGAQNGNPNLFPGTRGTPVGGGGTDHNATLRAQLQGKM